MLVLYYCLKFMQCSMRMEWLIEFWLPRHSENLKIEVTSALSACLQNNFSNLKSEPKYEVIMEYERQSTAIGTGKYQ